jgi:hypothetical protein
LTVDGVLTIAEDVMSNQGRKFIEMMERLADLRFRKEQEAKREVQEAGGPYEDDYDDDDEENGYYEGEDGEDSEEEEVYETEKFGADNRIPRSLRREEWTKVAACFTSLLLECLNNESLLPTKKKSLTNDN